MQTHWIGRRLAVLIGLCLALALGSAAQVAAYPVTPEGEPLYLETGTPTSSMAPEGILAQDGGAPQSSTATDAVPVTDITSSGTDWSPAISIVVVAGLAALALLAAAFVLNGHRRRSAGAQ
jgi:hypothetical protein